ncbi:MAG: sigma-70 family RNA polymerase sigma factor [Saprospiraceae bacterium]
MKVQIENMTEDQMLRMAAGSKPLGQTLFMQRYKGLVRAVVSRYLDDPDDVEEVVQDAFIRIFKSIENFRGDCKLSTWISRVASSAALTRLRWKRSRIQLEREDTLALERLGGFEQASGLE